MLVGARQRLRFEAQPIDFERRDLIEPRAAQQTIQVAAMNIETVEASGLGIGMQRDFVRLPQSKLFHRDERRSRSCVLERNLDLKFVRLRRFPLRLKRLALLVLDIHPSTHPLRRSANAACRRAPQSARLVLRRDHPLPRSRRPQTVARPIKRTKSPTRAEFH